MAELPDNAPGKELLGLLRRAADRPLDETELAQVNEMVTGLEAFVKLRYTALSNRGAQAVVSVGPHLHQPWGAVHGGVYSALAESVGSMASVIAAGAPMVGVHIATDFLRPVREGDMTAEAHPLHCGRRTHLWEITMTQAGKTMAVSRLRTMPAHTTFAC